MDHKMSRSPWVIHYDGSSCNGCDIEVLASLTPLFDAERFGVVNTGNPKHADIFLVTGSVNAQNLPVVRQIYNQMLEPKCVVACGICACSGGVFRDAYNVIGGVDRAIPVDVYAPGCAIRPETVIDAIVEACGILDQKEAVMFPYQFPFTKGASLPGNGARKECLEDSAAAMASSICFWRCAMTFMTGLYRNFRSSKNRIRTLTTVHKRFRFSVSIPSCLRYQPKNRMISRATTKPKIAVPSARAAPSRRLVWILPEASGWRLMASVALPVAMPMPMPPPIPVSAAIPAPRATSPFIIKSPL